MATDKKSTPPGLSRRRLLRQAVATGAGLGALTAGGAGRLAFMGRALAADQPPIGTYPDCCSGPTVTIGAAVPLTGSYADAGADELKGWQLAVEHLNEGNELIKKIAPKISKGVLGKTVNLVFADSGAKPNNAVQIQQTFINDHKIVLMTGSTSSAVAVATNHFAQREKVSLRHRHLRFERHHRQGLRALRLPPGLLWPDCCRRDRPGAGEELR